MVNNSITLTQGVWTLVSSNVDYLVQNKSAEVVLIKATASATAPTDTNGAFAINPGELIGSTLLSGYIYAMCPTDTVSLVVAV